MSVVTAVNGMSWLLAAVASLGIIVQSTRLVVYSHGGCVVDDRRYQELAISVIGLVVAAVAAVIVGALV